ncbi:MAG: ABC transporter ATP-binding protein [Candidatus Kariarchaeaceae archaeon]|jgi:ABC-type multidrug transport system fused ATPase/permease subunit
MSAIHTDADKELKRGSFGYSDMELYKFMFGYVTPYIKELTIILLLMIIFSIATAVGPIILMSTIDRFGNEGTTAIFGVEEVDVYLFGFAVQLQDLLKISQTWSEVLVMGITYLLLQILIYIVTYKRIIMVSEVGLKAEVTIRLEMFSHLQELDMSYHDKNEIGRIMSRLTGDISAIREMIGGQVVNNFANMLTVVAVLFVIIQIDPVLTLIPVGLIPIVIFIGILSKKYARPRRKETRRTNSIMMANIGEAIAGIKVTKVANREKENIEIFRRLNQDNFVANIRADVMNAIFFPLMLSMSTLGVALIVYVGGLRVIAGVITIGGLAAFLVYNAILFRPVVLLGQFYQQLQDALTGAERAYALLNTETKIPDQRDKPELNHIKGEVVFDRIYFEYVKDEPIYDGFSLYVPAGSTIALVGKTGAGKSTIVGMLSRMYDYQDGELRIDGTPVKSVSLPSYRDQIATVPQDFFLFSTSIKENLKLGNPLATEEDMWKALENVGLKEYVMGMEDGLDTKLQERGSRLSVGQRQLLVFAAVLLANPRILVLDEATSSIDVFSELKIQDATELLLKDRTSFIIAHRLSTIRNANTIVVIDDGDIVEQGTHEELLKQKGHYYQLVKNQIELSEIEN